jgi:hypothetical protein
MWGYTSVVTTLAEIKALGSSGKLAAGGMLLGVFTAYAVAVALGGAFRESEMLDVLVSLTLPPLVLFFVYKTSPKRAVFCVASLLIAALCFDLSPTLGIARAGVNLVFLTVGALLAPVVVDLFAVDMGKQIHVTRPLAQLAQLAFLLAVFPFAGWKLTAAHSTIVKEDERLAWELASHLQAEGNLLVVDQLDRKTADRALRRLAIRTPGRTYPLSDADVESVRETRTVRKTTHAHGTDATEITRNQEDRLRLILKLQGTGIPDEVVIYSHRGPLPIAEARVW